MTETLVEITDVPEAWFVLSTYCRIHQRLYDSTTGRTYNTMTRIYALKDIDKHDISAIHTLMNNILEDIDSLTSMFKVYYNDIANRVILRHILEYLQSHIGIPAEAHQGPGCRTNLGIPAEGSTETVHGQSIELSVVAKCHVRVSKQSCKQGNRLIL